MTTLLQTDTKDKKAYRQQRLYSRRITQHKWTFVFYRTFDPERANLAWYSARRIASNVMPNAMTTD
jgi:hypothetical protein